jgi:hypothetical protein
MRRFAFLAAVSCVCGCALSGTGRASIITENFTMTIGPPPVALNPVPAINSFGTSVPQFNPANGTLTSVSFSLTGSVMWNSSSASPDLLVKGVVTGSEAVFGLQNFSTPGTLTINLSGSASDPGTLAGVTGAGTVSAGLNILDFSGPPVGTGTFETGTGGLSGTLTYTFTPATTPEPASLTLFSISALGLIGYAWRKRRRAAA